MAAPALNPIAFVQSSAGSDSIQIKELNSQTL